MTTIELKSFLLKALMEGVLQNGDTIKIEGGRIYWSNDGGYHWERM